MQQAVPDAGLPPPAELVDGFAGAATAAPGPPGGGPELRAAAAGYWHRRGLATDPGQTAAAPGGPALLLALVAAVGGEVLLPRPSASWYAAQPAILGRAVHRVPTTAESGGAPDPVALLETVRRVRAEGGDPRLLVLSVADDPTGTVPPPELVHEACEAAAREGLLVVSDETYRDTLHDPHATVLVSPAEMLPDDVVVLADLGGTLTPPGWPAAVARFPATRAGAVLHAAALAVLGTAVPPLPPPVEAAAAAALAEPPAVTGRLAAGVRLHTALTAAVRDVLTAAGALVRPPQAGYHVYADLEALRRDLARGGVVDAVDLETAVVRALGPGTRARAVAGAQRFGDDLTALRLRVTTAPLLGGAGGAHAAALAPARARPPAAAATTLTPAAAPVPAASGAPAAPGTAGEEQPDPAEWPQVAEALRSLGSALTELTGVRR
ncbi:aminotransferase class I/II-fold pyridoxal phosphate-dependent enzyme [Streptomyces sp. CMB-StM0423]|uniref:aminotransferase class I/II-fold pyridoxal phosphate-dependent enzyme n=1 Tax=Streptomyces sp. CMB-StM0423 TaxID=2059884 RepID=UPI000C70431F|nr:aminotransferase class I/II-fold pyridoxal phosphate-dependent enzyme [Streptomyces sp. CMB-StM0423]AUH39684.1 aminopeptidase [Streptomyces sp. CMB-StM0423]